MRLLFILENVLLEQEPIGIMSLSAVLKGAGHAVAALNADASGEGLRAEIERFAPDVLGYSISSNCSRKMITLNRKIKGYCDALSLFGGPHPTYFPEMIEEPGIDMICLGEGETAVLELAEAIDSGNDFTAIANLWVKRDGRIYRNAPRCLVEDLDSLPTPDHDLVADLIPLATGGTNFVMSGRGCPFDCSYCFNHLARGLAPGRFVRRRSVGSVVAHMKWLKLARGTRFFSIQDDTFSMHPSWLDAFAERYAAEVGLPFMCHGRADLIDDAMAERLARAGCVVLCMGLEAGNDELREGLLAKTVTREDLHRAAAALRRHHILVLTQNMVGIPHETPATVLETIGLNRSCGVDIMQLMLYTPHPRTKLAEYACEHGFFDESRFDSLPETYFDGWLALDLEDKDEILALYRLANSCLDFRRGFYRAVRLASRLPRPLRLRAYAWLERTAAKLRARGRGHETRAQDWSVYYDLRNPLSLGEGPG